MNKEKSTAFLKGTLSLSISVIIIKIIGVAFKVPLSYVLADVGMGYFNTAYAIYGFFYILCTAGVPKSITLILAGYGLAYDRENDRIFILKTALRLFGIIGALVTIINIILAPALARIIGNSNACLSLYAIAPSIFFVSLSGVLRGYLNSEERLTSIAVSQLLEGVVKLAFGLALAFVGVRFSASVSAISALAISGITLGSAASFLYLIITVFSLNNGENNGQNSNLSKKNINREIVKNALPIALSSSLLNLSSTLDIAIIIKRLVSCGMSEIMANSLYGNYTTLALPMFTLVISVLAPVATSYMPRLSNISLSGDKNAFALELNKLLMIIILISVPASLAFYFYSFDLLDVLFSLQSSAVGADMLVCLSFGVCLLTTLTVINTALESQGRVGMAVFSLLVGAVVKIVSTYIFVGKEDIGIFGAPMGTVVSYAISLLISLFALEISGVKARALVKCIAVYFVGIICFYPPYKTIYTVSATGTSFTSMMCALTISGVLYILVLALVYILLSRSKVFNMHKRTI